jgi:hypothetical protein
MRPPAQLCLFEQPLRFILNLVPTGLEQHNVDAPLRQLPRQHHPRNPTAHYAHLRANRLNTRPNTH